MLTVSCVNNTHIMCSHIHTYIFCILCCLCTNIRTYVRTIHMCVHWSVCTDGLVGWCVYLVGAVVGWCVYLVGAVSRVAAL